MIWLLSRLSRAMTVLDCPASYRANSPRRDPAEWRKNEARRNNDEEKVNINTADLNELISLKGIGVKTAEWIIEHRQVNGPFFCKEDIMKIKGIGPAKYNAIKENIIVE